MSSNQTVLNLDPGNTPTIDARRNPFAVSQEGVSSARFDQLVQDALSHWHVPGIAISIIDQHQITSRGYGVAQLAEGQKDTEGGALEPPVTPNTLFNCASMSKSFTAAAMARLVDDKDLKDVQWRTPASKLCEDMVFSNEEMTRNITMEDILCHRTGLPGHDEALRGIQSKNTDTPATVTRNLRNLPFSRPLRTEEQYNNTLYTAASHVISTVSKTPFADFLSANFWKPLAMDRTFLGIKAVPDAEQSTLAQGYIWLNDKKEYLAIPHNPDPAGAGCGEIISSVQDWARWVHAFIHRSSILSNSAYDELSTPRILSSQENGSPFRSATFNALGWEVEWYHGYKIISHDGLWDGFTSCQRYIPALNWGFVMMSNAERAAGALVELEWHLIDEVLEIPSEKRYDWRTWIETNWAKYLTPKPKEELFPELADLSADKVGERPSLAEFAGLYKNDGYHETIVSYDEKNDCLIADFSDRSSPFEVKVKEHAFGLWFAAELRELTLPENITAFRCQLEVDDKGRSSRLGMAICSNLDGLIWFDRVDGATEDAAPK